MTDRLLIGTRKGLFTLRLQAGRWSVTDVDFPAIPVSMLTTLDGGRRMIAALNHGHFGVKLHRSDDRGDSWQEISAPAYPDPPAGGERDPFGKEVPWKLLDVWELRPGGPDQTERLWCGTIPGGVFKTDDCGDSWHLVESLWRDERRQQWMGGGKDNPGVHSICVDPRDSRTVRIAVSCGGVWVTRDDGQSWEPQCDGMRAAYMPPERQFDPLIQDPHQMVQCSGHPDAFWVQHHNGIFRSTDSCAHWQEIETAGPSTFGFAVAVHPNDPDTAWFVPAEKDEVRTPVDGRVVVTRTRDGGKSFDVLRQGLPQEHAYDLVYRHALDVDTTGDVLAFGSTTGSLWVTKNGGDAWEHVSGHLPPIYCVRFG